MSTITISEQLGSLGTRIARGVAEKIHYKYLDKDKLGEILTDYGFGGPTLEEFDEKSLRSGTPSRSRGPIFCIRFRRPFMILPKKAGWS